MRRIGAFCKRYFVVGTEKEVSFRTVLGLGLSAGCLGSLVGMGGGFVALPFLTGPFGIPQNVAHATSMAAVLATSIGGSCAYLQRQSSHEKVSFHGVEVVENIGNVHVPTATFLAASSSLTVILGAKISKALPAKYLKLALGLFMIVIGPMVPARSYFKEKYSNRTSSSADTNSKASLMIKPLIIGSASGLLAGIFGVGGGALVVPALCLFTDLNYQVALGTSLAAMLPTAISGCTTQYLQGMMNMRCAVPLGLGCLIGSYAGGRCVERVGDKSLQYGFGAVLCTLGVRTLYQALRLVR